MKHINKQVRRKKDGFMGRLKHKQNPWCLELLAPSIKLHIYPKTEMWIGLNEFAQLTKQPTHCCEVVSTCLSILDQWIPFN